MQACNIWNEYNVQQYYKSNMNTISVYTDISKQISMMKLPLYAAKVIVQSTNMKCLNTGTFGSLNIIFVWWWFELDWLHRFDIYPYYEYKGRL